MTKVMKLSVDRQDEVQNMEIRNNLEGLSSLLGVQMAESPVNRAKTQSAEDKLLGTDQATLSTAATQMAEATAEDGVRFEKVAAIQAALASGTYSVPASAVASKVVDAMLGGN